MFEFMANRDLMTSAKTDWDVVPQMQVTISRRQHIRGNLGLRIPVTDTTGRQKQIIFYLLWDWQDGRLQRGLVMTRKIAGACCDRGVRSFLAQWLTRIRSEPQAGVPHLRPLLGLSQRTHHSNGHDISIGVAWRSSIMANSARDPYWQASVRRETIDHAEVIREIEDECSVCHMPIARYKAKVHGEKGRSICASCRFDADKKDAVAAEDGVTCSVCHQIRKEKLGNPRSFNGGFVIDCPPTPKTSVRSSDHSISALNASNHADLNRGFGRYRRSTFATPRYADLSPALHHGPWS